MEQGKVESAEPWLLRLPPAALERIWVLLRTRHWSEDEWDQHALRCTCRALRAATAPLVPACLHIRAPRTAPWDEPPDTAGLSTPEILSSHAQDCLQDAWEQFEDYPSDCHLCALDLQFSEPWFADDRDIHLGNRPVMPAIIPTFFLLEGRLSKLLRLKLACTLAITLGDMHAVASACPQLECVCIGTRRNGGYAVVGPALLPLRTLRHLSCVELHSIILPHGHLGFGPSLAALTQLERLVVQDAACFSDLHLQPIALKAQHVVPYIKALTNLRHLDICCNDTCTDNLLCCLSGARHMTSLRVHSVAPSDAGHAEPQHRSGNERDGEVQLPAFCIAAEQLSTLSHMQQLQSLMLPNARLDAAAIQTLAQLSALTRLRVESLNPERDLSAHLTVPWQDVVLQCLQGPPQQLLMLPRMPEGCRLVVVKRGVRWSLCAADSLQATAQALRRACQVLAATWASWPFPGCRGGYAGRVMPKQVPAGKLSLEWDAPLPAEASAACHELLGALSPLQGMQGCQTLDLGLSHEWRFGGQHMQQLLQALPGLVELSVEVADDVDVNNLAAAAAVLGDVARAGLRQLQVTLPTAVGTEAGMAAASGQAAPALWSQLVTVLGSLAAVKVVKGPAGEDRAEEVGEQSGSSDEGGGSQPQSRAALKASSEPEHLRVWVKCAGVHRVLRAPLQDQLQSECSRLGLPDSQVTFDW